MADIKQAAKWLEAGKKITRKNQMPEQDFLVLDKDDFIIYVSPGLEDAPPEFELTDFFSDDWEIYDPTN